MHKGFIRSLVAAAALLVALHGAPAQAVCSCLNNASVRDLDTSTGGGDGQFAESVIVSAPAGQTWRVVAATQVFDAENVPTAGVQSVRVPVATDGSVLLTAIATTTYKLNFVTLDAATWSLSVSNGLGTTLTIGGRCGYPSPDFSPALAASYAAEGPAIVLGATDATGAGLASSTFQINGISQTALVPAAYVGRTSNSVLLTATGSVVPTLGGTRYPGCVQPVRKSFAVAAARPIPTIDPFGLALMSALLAGLVFFLWAHGPRARRGRRGS